MLIYSKLHSKSRYFLTNYPISNGNRTEWSTIQGVIRQVISERYVLGRFKITSAITPELYDTKSYYQLIVTIKKSRLGNLWEPLLCEKIIGLLSRLFKQQQNNKKEPILGYVIDARMAKVSNYRYSIWSCSNWTPVIGYQREFISRADCATNRCAQNQSRSRILL